MTVSWDRVCWPVELGILLLLKGEADEVWPQKSMTISDFAVELCRDSASHSDRSLAETDITGTLLLVAPDS